MGATGPGLASAELVSGGETVKRDPLQRILLFLAAHKVCTIDQIATGTRQPRSVVSRHLRSLVDDGAIVRQFEDPRRPWPGANNRLQHILTPQGRQAVEVLCG